MIKKAEVMNSLSEVEESQAAQLEAAIDATLKSFDGSSVHIAVGGGGYARNVINVVAERYRSDGCWNVDVDMGNRIMAFR